MVWPLSRESPSINIRRQNPHFWQNRPEVGHPPVDSRHSILGLELAMTCEEKRQPTCSPGVRPPRPATAKYTLFVSPLTATYLYRYRYKPADIGASSPSARLQHFNQSR